jgi:hypothetical protein
LQLGAGTFNLNNGLILSSQPNIVIRGMGANQTFLVFSNSQSCQGFGADVCFQSYDLNYTLNPENLTNWTANYAAGTTSITLSTVANLSVGTPIVLDQTDDTIDSGDINVCYSPTTEASPCSTNGDNGGFARAGRSQMQIVTVTGISGSGPFTVGITPGIYMPNWSSAKSPQAWWSNGPISNVGIENLSMNHSAAEPNQGTGVGVLFFNCRDCWVSGVTSIAPGRSHVMSQIANRITVQNSYFYETAGHTSTSYGVESNGTADMLIQNNIFQQVTEPMSLNGSCSGCVEAYNFDIDDLYGTSPFAWRMASSLPHAAGLAHVLMEGNQGSGLQADIIHGSHHFITTFRNVWSGYQLNNGVAPTNNISAIIMNALNRFFNHIGNVLGSSVSNGYQSGSQPIYQVGASESAGYTVPFDSNVRRTLMLWGNYDTFTGAVRWCGNSSNTGWVAICGSTSEVPSTITNYSNAIPASTTLPPSFYLSSEPSWWPSGKPWPPIGPDVTGGNIPGVAGHAYTIPAADCYVNVMNGPANGTGAVLSFNAGTCYGGQQTTSSPLAAPTSLAAVAR